MIDELKDKILLVTFTKVNGDKREMLCTLREDMIPKISGKSKPQEGVTTVFDLENQGWRSFRTDSVISVEEQSL